MSPKWPYSDTVLMGFIWKTLFFELNETLLVGDPKQPFPDLPQISGFRTYPDIDPKKGLEIGPYPDE